MEDRLKNCYYSTRKLFVADMSRIFANCRTYNGPDTEYYRCAGVVERFFLSKLKEYYAGHGKEKKIKGKISNNILVRFLLVYILIYFATHVLQLRI